MTAVPRSRLPSPLSIQIDVKPSKERFSSANCKPARCSASFDILRLYDLKDPQHPHASTASRHSTVPFLIIPGHRGGVISTLYTDPTCRYLISAAGNRGWEGHTTEVLLGYEINC